MKESRHLIWHWIVHDLKVQHDYVHINMVKYGNLSITPESIMAIEMKKAIVTAITTQPTMVHNLLL